MKKILAFLLVALLAVALVACGDTGTTTATTTAADTSTTVADTTTVAPDEGGDDPDIEDPKLFDTGIDIMNGDYEYAAINPFWNQGSWPCAFEGHHVSLDFNWSLVFTMDETLEGVYEDLVFSDETLPNGWEMNDEYKWVVVIDDVEHEIERFSLINNTYSGYIRMDLGSKFVPQENHEYEIVLKILNAETEELVYWAWFTEWGTYTFTMPEQIVMVPDEKLTADIDAGNIEELPKGAVIADLTKCPVGFNADETAKNLFDNDVRSKLCTTDLTSPIVFYISEDYIADDSAISISSISLVGANDDENYPERLVVKFTVYGASSNDENTVWTSLKTVDLGAEDIGTVVNYGERNYEFENSSNYRYYKIEIEHTAGDTYQISDILLYADK